MISAPALSRADWGALLLLSMIWGSGFILIDFAVEGLPPPTVVAMRVSLAAVLLYVALRARGQRMPMQREAVTAYLIGGTLGVTLPFMLIAWGQTQIGGGLASILNAMVPIWGVVLAHLVTDDEKLSWPRGIGVALGFVGVVMVIGPDALRNVQGGAILGQAAVVAAAFCYASGSVFSRRFKRMGIGPLPTSIGNLVVAAVTLVPIALLVDKPWTFDSWPLVSVLSVVGLAVFCTAFAFILFFSVLSNAGATNTQLVTYLIPVSALLMGALLRGEFVSSTDICGMAVIAMGLAVIDGRPFNAVRQRLIGVAAGR